MKSVISQYPLSQTSLKTVFVYTTFNQIFTEDLPEVEGLPRDQVLEHIEQNAKDLVIRYLVRTS